MKYTFTGLKIPLNELRQMLEYAENRAMYGNMESCIYIKGGERPRIIQFCHYSDCNPIDHTTGATYEDK